MSLHPAMPALLLLTGCMLDEMEEELRDKAADATSAYNPGVEVEVEDATAGDDAEGRGGGLPATVSLTLDVGSADIEGMAYDVGIIEVELGDNGWRPLTDENTGGTDEVMVDMEPVYLIADTITGFRMSFDAATAMIEGVATPIIISPVETAGSWPTEEGADYTITLTVDGGPLVEDLQGQHWVAELSVTDFTELVGEDTGQ